MIVVDEPIELLESFHRFMLREMSDGCDFCRLREHSFCCYSMAQELNFFLRPYAFFGVNNETIFLEELKDLLDVLGMLFQGRTKY